MQSQSLHQHANSVSSAAQPGSRQPTNESIQSIQLPQSGELNINNITVQSLRKSQQAHGFSSLTLSKLNLASRGLQLVSLLFSAFANEVYLFDLSR